MKWHLKHRVHGNKPWAVQAEAMLRSQDRERYGYFLEQGLGKTSLCLNDVVEYIEQGAIDTAVVLAPNSFRLDWEVALDEWQVPLEIGIGKWPKEPDLRGFPTIYSINYEATWGRAKSMLYDLLNERKVMLIIDESLAIKNFKSKTARTVMDMAKLATMVRINNGTPIVQNVMDYFPQLKVLGELDGQNPYAFRNRHAVMGGFMGKQVLREIRNEKELYKLLDRCSFRALKEDWRKDLPPKVYTPVHLDMTPKQRHHYKEMMEDFYTLVQGIDVEADMVLTQMAKLRQISSCLAKQGDSEYFFEFANDNPKVRAVFDILEGGPGKAIVVHYHKSVGMMIYNELEAAGYRPARIAGGMKHESVMDEKDRFNNNPACRVLVGQIDIAAKGHTLLGGTGADRCNKTIFFENSFRYDQRAHMEDRNHRGEQDQTCQIFDLITSPMDQVVVDALQGKRSMANAIDAVVAVVKRWRK